MLAFVGNEVRRWCSPAMYAPDETSHSNPRHLILFPATSEPWHFRARASWIDFGSHVSIVRRGQRRLLVVYARCHCQHINEGHRSPVAALALVVVGCHCLAVTALLVVRWWLVVTVVTQLKRRTTPHFVACTYIHTCTCTVIRSP